MKHTVCKRLVLLLVLMAILLCAGCSKAPDYTGFSDTATLLSVLQLAEKGGDYTGMDAAACEAVIRELYY